MKWFFYLAVLLNITYFAYNISYTDTLVIPERVSPNSNLNQTSDKSIVLLNEVDPEKIQVITQTSTKRTTQTTKYTPPERDLEKVNSNSMASSVVSNPDKDASEIANIEKHNNKLYITGIEIIEKTVPQNQQEPNSEQQLSAPENNVASTTEPEKEQNDDSQNLQIVTEDAQRSIHSCFKLGPFKKQQLDSIKLELEQLYGNRISFGIETTSKITYYRIYIPPLKTRELRKEALAKLDQNGMTDHYVMSIDGRKNAIALGVFKKRQAAEKVAARANKLGFSTTIEAISDDKNSLYNLQLVLKTDEKLDALNTLITKKRLKLTECDK